MNAKNVSGKFAQRGNSYFPHGAGAPTIHPKLPAAVYVLMFHPEQGFYLEMTESFTMPKKLYGSTTNDSARILKTFHDRGGCTGVILAGEMGSGKTLLAKQVAIDAVANHNMPIIMVNKGWCGDNFNAFIQSINQPAMVFFDEFEKTYDEEDQEQILTLLDGTVQTQKLFMFTVNNKYSVNKHMQNRPGRIFYFKEYKGVDSSFIREYCEDNLKAELQVHIQVIEQYATLFYAFNFDMLKAICEEMNRYDETPQQALSLLNARPSYGAEDISYKLQVTAKSSEREIHSQQYNGNPLIKENFMLGFNYWVDGKGELFETAHAALKKAADLKLSDADLDKVKRKACYIGNSNLKEIDKDGVLRYENDVFVMTLTKTPEKAIDALGYMAQS